MATNESKEHQSLVEGQVNAYLERGYTILQAACDGYDQPTAIKRHTPDVLAREPNGLLYICEAEAGLDDFRDQTTLEQFADFSNRIMSSGPLNGTQVPFDIAIPASKKARLAEVLKENGITNCTIWTMDV